MENKMREIKFRGIPIKAKEENFIEGDLIKTDEGRYFIFPYLVDLTLSNLAGEIEGSVYSGFGLLVEINPETLGQYTGLKDKNGKEIYEGDIVEKKSIEYLFNGEEKIITWKGVVVYKAPKFIFQGKDGYYLAGTYGFEVIGNIYDNPELLKNEGLND